jgi:hypothetical protein
MIVALLQLSSFSSARCDICAFRGSPRSCPREKMSSIFERFLGPAFLLLGLLALLCSLPASPARAGGQGTTPGPCPPEGRQGCGDPIILPFGDVYEKVTDFTTEGQNPLAVTRQYNGYFTVPFYSFGSWRWSFDSYLSITLPSEVDAFRPDGKQVIFTPDGKGGWKGPSNFDLRLTQSGSTWTLTDWEDATRTTARCWSAAMRAATRSG